MSIQFSGIYQQIGTGFPALGRVVMSVLICQSARDFLAREHLDTIFDRDRVSWADPTVEEIGRHIAGQGFGADLPHWFMPSLHGVIAMQKVASCIKDMDSREWRTRG